jgi:glycolate oxidase iron-sulfur subunit
MAEIQELVSLLKELEDQMVSCMKCGMCQAACPLYAETGRETDVARGKIALVENLASEMLKDPQAVKERLDRCLLCGSCAASCPSGVRVLDIFLKARAIITGYLGLSPAKRAVFRGMLARPRLLSTIFRLASAFQGMFTKPANTLLGSSCARFPASFLKNRHFMPLSGKPWHRRVGEIDTAPGASGIKVAFFQGCLADKVFDSLADACLEVFRHHGVGVFCPDTQVCCGIPALSSGDRTSFEKLLHQILDLYFDREWDYLVTPCATCTATIKKIWPLMTEHLSGETRRIVEDLKGRTLDVNEFLVEKLGVQPPGPRASDSGATAVTYHDPCHLKKSLGVAAQPRALLRCSPDHRIVEMAEPDRCCGMGGSFNLQHYDLSRRIGDRKLKNIADSGAQIVATGCPACMVQIIDLLSREGHSLRVEHPVQIYARALRQRSGSEPRSAEAA